MNWTRSGAGPVGLSLAKWVIAVATFATAVILVTACGSGGLIGPRAEPVGSPPSRSSPTSLACPPPTAAPSQSPIVFDVSPNRGTTAGGDDVTIDGSGFSGVTEVDFGNAMARIKSSSDRQIRVISPPGLGTVAVTVITRSGSATTGCGKYFTYVDLSSQGAGGS